MPAPNKGKWEIILSGDCPLNTQQEAVHSCIIFNQTTKKWKVLFYTAFYIENTPSPAGIKTRIWEPSTNTITAQSIPDWPNADDPPRLFCCGHAFDSEGKLITAGGHREPVIGGHWARGLKYTYKFNPVNETWEVAGGVLTPHAMADGRWYPTVTKLGWGGGLESKDKFVAAAGFKYDYRGGLPVFNETIEIYNPNTGWTLLPVDANMPHEFIERNANYPGVHLIPFSNLDMNIKAGEVFYPHPLKQAWRFNPEGQGNPNPYWNTVAQSRNYRTEGSSLMLPLKPNSNSMKFILIGGTEDHDMMPTAEVEMIDLSAQPSEGFSWNRLSDLNIPRKNVNSVILPDGKILIVGGNQLHLRETAVTICEMYDPEVNNGQGNSEMLPAMTYSRMYHSTAILLPDATVLVSGGEYLCTGIGNNNNTLNNTFEIYKPGYLFEGTRPEFITAPPFNVTYNQEVNIDTNLQIAEAILIKPGAPTHGFDQDQRAIYLQLTPLSPNGTNPYKLKFPSNGNIAPPGIYMLFILRPKSASASGHHKIPSTAKFIKLG